MSKLDTQNLKNSIASGKIKTVLAILKEEQLPLNFFNKVIQLNSRYSVLEGKKTQGTIFSFEENVEYNRISESLLILIDELHIYFGNEFISSGNITNNSPFRGLQFFDLEHKEFFFGRDKEIDLILDKLRHDPLLFIIGASGSGKSSLIRAGLVPSINLIAEDSNWNITVFRPKEKPIDSLAESLLKLNTRLSYTERLKFLEESKRQLRTNQLGLSNILEVLVESDSKNLIVVDQFEEALSIWTKGPKKAFNNSDDTSLFIKNLINASSKGGTRDLYVIFILRSDFYSILWHHDQLIDHFTLHNLPIKSLNEEQLWKVIEEPLKLKNVLIEPGLIERIVLELGTNEGNLPLLQYTLTKLWEKRGEEIISHNSYSKLGGVSGTLKNHFEDIFQSLSKEDQQLLKKIFLRLVQVNESTEDSKRIILYKDIIRIGENKEAINRIINYLVKQRLLVISDPKIDNTTDSIALELVHESIIKQWPRLKKWISESRSLLKSEKKLIEACSEWIDNNKDPEMLLRGKILTEIQKIFVEDQDFRMAQPEKVLEFYQKSLFEKRKRKRIVNSLKLGIPLLLVLILLSFFFIYNSNKNLKSISDVNKSIEYSIKAKELSDENPSVSLEYAIQANSFANTVEGEQALRDALLNPFPERKLSFNSPILKYQLFNDLLFVLETNSKKILLIDLNSGDTNSLFQDHQKNINSFELSQSGQLLAASFSDSTILILDVNSKKTLHHIFDESGSKSKLLFDSEEKFVICSGRNGVVNSYDLKNKKINPFSSSHLSKITSLSISPSKKNIVLTSSEDGTAKLWNFLTGELVQNLTGPRGEIFSASFNIEGTKILTTGQGDHGVRLWDVSSGNEIYKFEGHKDDVHFGSFSNDGLKIITTSDDNFAKIWSTKTNNEISTLYGHSNWIRKAIFLTDNEKVITCGYDNELRLWEISSGKCLAVMRSHEGPVTNVRIDSSDEYLISAGEDSTLIIWPRKSNFEAALLEGHSDWVNQIKFSQDGSYLATAGFDGKLIVRETSKWEPIRSINLHSQPVKFIEFTNSKGGVISTSEDSFGYHSNFLDKTEDFIVSKIKHSSSISTSSLSSNFSFLATAGYDKLVHLWDIRAGMKINTFKGHEGWVRSISFNNSGTKLLTSGDDGKAIIWMLKEGRPEIILNHTSEVWQSGFFGGDKKVLTISHDNNIRIWNATSGNLERTLFGHSEAVLFFAISHDQRKLATASSDKTIKIWDLESGGLSFNLKGHLDRVTHLAFSNDDSKLLSSSEDCTARLWNLNKGEVISVLKGHIRPVIMGTFSPDDSYIITCSQDKTSRVYFTESEKLIKEAKIRLNVSNQKF